jgi:hypothetical protein
MTLQKKEKLLQVGKYKSSRNCSLKRFGSDKRSRFAHKSMYPYMVNHICLRIDSIYRGRATRSQTPFHKKPELLKSHQPRFPCAPDINAPPTHQRKQIPIPIYAPEVDDAELPTFPSLVKSTGPSSPVVMMFLGLLGSRPKVPGLKSRLPSLSRFTLVAGSRHLAAALAARLTCMSYAASASTRLLSSSSFSSSSS